MTIKLAINGALGKMGRAVASIALADKQFRIACAMEVKNHPDIGKDYGSLLNGTKSSIKISPVLKKVDVMIDFSSASASMERLDECRNLRVGAVIGTTGFSKGEKEKINQTSHHIPILLSSNMSYTVSYLTAMLAETAKALGDSFSVELVEIHHRHKKDAPSGTALMLASSIASARNIKTENIKIHSVRLGDYVGEHRVIFATDGESVEITHRARSREIFAKGALVASQFIANAKPGLYSMIDVVKSTR